MVIIKERIHEWLLPLIVEPMSFDYDHLDCLIKVSKNIISELFLPKILIKNMFAL